MSISVFPFLNEDLEASDSVDIVLYNASSTDSFVTSIKSQSGYDFIDMQVLDEFGVPQNFYGMYEYSNNTFVSDIGVNTIEIVEGIPVATPAKISIIAYSGIEGYTLTKKDDYTLTLTGSPSSVFTNQSSSFLMPDLKTVKVLPLNTTEKYAALVSWSPPPITEIIRMHNITILINYNDSFFGQPMTAVKTLSIPQKIIWRYDVGIAGFRNALSKGTI